MMITTTFILGPPFGRYSSGSLAKRLHPAVPSNARPAAPAPATFKKSLRVNVCANLPSSQQPTYGARTAAYSKAKIVPVGRGIGVTLGGSSHVRFERLGELVHWSEFSGVLPLHVPHEFLLGGEVHLGVAPLLFVQSGEAPALVVVSGEDDKVVRQALEGVIQRVVLPRGVAVRQV